MQPAQRSTRAKGALPGYAGGGMIGAFKRAIGLEQDTPERAAYKAQAKAAREAQTTPAPKADNQAITDYAGMSAMQRREKEAGFKEGGPVKGPGTTTSDSIPIMASNGEFMIKASAVKAIGLKTLEALNAMGDTPAKSQKPAGAIQKLAGGGPVKGLFPYNQPETDIYKDVGLSSEPSAPAAPLDAQAAADQATASKFLGGALDVNNRVGASIADIASMVPRGLAGAYDSAVIRPIRAMGGNLDYVSPKLTPDGADPASMTPFYDNIRKQDAATAQTPTQQATSTTAANQAPITENAVVRNAMAAGAPRPASPVTTGATGAGAVRRVGNSYSGENVSGDISLTDGQGNPIKRGGTVSSLDTSAGYAQDLKDLARIEEGKKATEANLQAQATYAENKVLEQKALAGNRNAEKILAQRTNDSTTRRGQDATATNQTATQRLAENRFGLDSANAELENKAKNMVLTAQTAFMNAKTPEEKQSALATLAGLSGKESAQKAQYAYAPGGQMIDPVTGQTVTQPGVIFNQYTGETTQPGQKQALPKGMVKQVGTANGKPVYEDANGKRYQ